MRIHLLCCVSFVLFLSARTERLYGEVLGFHFSGQVTRRFADPWMQSIADQTNVSGMFLYDTIGDITHPFSEICTGTCAGYRQQIEGGFQATFSDNNGPVHVQANDYVVGVFNDTEDSEDVFFIQFNSALDPPPTVPLIVNGLHKSVGLFGVSLSGPATIFPDTSLPKELTLNDFEATTGTLSDLSSSVPDVLFSITSLERIESISGDYNFDLQVNSDDYLRWKTLFGSTSDLTADGNRNRVVDTADYTVWRDNVGSIMLPTSAALPEPSTELLLVAATILIPCVGRRKPIRSNRSPYEESSAKKSGIAA